jgi:Fic family protein
MKQDKKKALFIADKLFAELVFDVQRLEGMPFTLPEVQTYLQGVTVGGHKVRDVTKLEQQRLGWRALIDRVQAGTFDLTKDTACALQAIVAKDEALDLGRFRSGKVGIAGTEYEPPPASELGLLFSGMVRDVLALDDVREQAFRVHLDMARNQFFYDGNKRTGLFMANGHLMAKGYPPFSIPAKRQLEYNTGMIAFYDSCKPGASVDHGPMIAFLRECHEAMYKRFE